MHRDPLGAIHLRRADLVGGHARIDERSGRRSAGRATRRGRRRRTSPCRACPRREDRGSRRGSSGRRVALRDELVDVLEALVVPHVDDHAAVGRERHHCALVLEAAERGALYRLRERVGRIDLHHPAELVGLGRVRVGVEAAVELVPAVAAPFADDAVAALLGRNRSAFDEVAVEVLLAREIGAPRRAAAAAVVEGAERFAVRRACCPPRGPTCASACSAVMRRA